MEFRLLFRGHLPSEDKARVEDKHEIRKQLHSQLQEVWRSHPVMRGAMKPDGSGLSEMEKIADRYNRCGFHFLPLIRENENACSLNIVILFRHEPYRAYNCGDLDNRIKTLVDGMRMPKQCTELPKGIVPSVDEDPFCVLMDDDKVIYEFQVTTDQSFLPFERDNKHGEAYRDVVALIGVRLTTVGRNPITYLS